MPVPRSEVSTEAEEVKESKRIVDIVLNKIINITEGVENVTLDDVLTSCDISVEQYEHAMDTMQRQTTILYKRQTNDYHSFMLSGCWSDEK